MVKSRKVQKTGGSTYTVSLPKKWVGDRLEEGDTVQMERSNGQIKLSLSGSDSEVRATSLLSSEDFDVTRRRLVAAYLNGFDRISILEVKEKEKLLDFIRNNLIGIEIVKIEEDSVEVRNLFKSGEFPLKNGLRRMNSTIITMMEDLVDDPKKVKEMDDILDRYYLLLLRQLVLVMKNPDLKEEMDLRTDLQLMDYRLIAKSLERIGDHLVEMADKELRGKKIDLFILTYKNISEAMFSADLSQVEEQIRELESIEELEENHSERIRRLMLDICETTVNFSINESDVLRVQKSEDKLGS